MIPALWSRKAAALIGFLAGTIFFLLWQLFNPGPLEQQLRTFWVTASVGTVGGCLVAMIRNYALRRTW